jgi:hypothetical protein
MTCLALHCGRAEPNDANALCTTGPCCCDQDQNEHRHILAELQNALQWVKIGFSSDSSLQLFIACWLMHNTGRVAPGQLVSVHGCTPIAMQQWWFITLRLVGQENEAALLLRLAERTSTHPLQ